jgi:hypothetical protein
VTVLLREDVSLDERRSTLGASTVVWAGCDGVTVGPDRWVALSRADSVEYNAALAHGSGAALEETLDEVLAARVPAVVMVAGRAARETRRLRDRGWIRIGSMALMHLELRERVSTPSGLTARRLGRADYRAATELVGEVFGVGRELAGVAISGVTAELSDQALWGAFDPAGMLVSCLATARVADTVTVWSMATSLPARRRGYGAAALGTALAAAAAEGATSSLLSSSEVGEPLYRSFGYQELERWEQWSRPRWALART